MARNYWYKIWYELKYKIEDELLCANPGTN